jgi:CheY-like chemotaxis protein
MEFLLAAPRYPDDLSSIPRANQAAWLEKPATPIVLGAVFNRRKILVTSDLHVLLVTADQSERLRMKDDLEGLGYRVTAVSSGKIAQDLLTERAEYHVVMVSVSLSSEHGEGPDCVSLLHWARDAPTLKEVGMIVLGGFSVEPSHTIELIRCGAPAAAARHARLSHATLRC